MARKQKNEKEDFIRLQAQQAQAWQKQVESDQDLEQWVVGGNMDFLEKKVFAEIELEAFRTIKNPSYDASNVWQAAQFKALCQVMDVIREKINSRVQAVRDARAKLADLEISTQMGEEERR